jgi:hypothetical protein
MSISMLLKDRRDGRWEEIPVCTNSRFVEYWESAAADEGLEMIQALGGLWVTAQYRDRFLGELAQLKGWASSHAVADEYLPEMVRRIDTIMEAVESHPIDDYEISFG